jgi:hypothetical protein
MLREIQSDIGLMDSYLQHPRKLVRPPVDSDALHRKVVTQHGFLTNGMSEFITELFPSTKSAMHTFRVLRSHPQLQQQHQITPEIEVMEELEEYIDHMHFRAKAELSHHDRMLSRMNLYLQVVSQEIQLSCTDQR